MNSERGPAVSGRASFGWFDGAGSVDRRSVLVVAAIGPREEIDLVGKDLRAIPRHTVLVFPLRVVDTALDRDQLAFRAILTDGLGEAVEAGHTVEFAVLGGVAVLVLVGLAVLVACRTIGDDSDPGNAGSALGFAGVRRFSELPGRQLTVQ